MIGGRHISIVLLGLVATLLSSNHLAAQLPNDPLLHYRSDTGLVIDADRVTRWEDISGNNNDATAPGPAPTLAPAASGRPPMVSFIGGSYLRGPNVMPVGSDYTKIVVLRITNPAAVNNILSGSNGHALWMQGALNPSIFQNGTFVRSRYPVDSGQLFLVVATFSHDEGRGMLHIDGLFAGAGLTTNRNADSTIHVGAYGGGYTLAGDVAEVLLYDRILGEEERKRAETMLLDGYDIERAVDPFDLPYLTSFPHPMQLYPRDSDDSARVAIAGTVTDPGYTDAILTITRSGDVWKRVSTALDYDNGTAPFRFDPTIAADTVSYGFRLELARLADTNRLIAERTDILCGDAIVIAGQSNSIFGNQGATWASTFARSFGSNTAYGRYDPSDTLWGLAQARTTSGSLAVGAWGLELQRLIVEEEGMPIAVINGGVSGSRIEQNLPPGVPENLASVYGRTAYRTRQSDLSDQVRALYWYQGESNSDTGYYDNFRTLYSAWLDDYPALERIYVVQIRPGCALGNRHTELRELLRTLPDSFAGDPVPITAYSPTAVPGHDGCHYNLEGYRTIGEQLYRLTARDLYGSSDTIDIASPTLRRARYVDEEERFIRLDFEPVSTDIVWQGGLRVGDTIRLLVDAFLLDDVESLVTAGSAHGSTVFIETAEPSGAERVSYVPEDFYPGTSTLYQGPWLMTSRGVGALTFAGVPVEPWSSLSVGDRVGPRRELRAQRTDGVIRVDYRVVGGNPIDPDLEFLLVDAEGRIVARSLGEWSATGAVATFAIDRLPIGEYFVLARTSSGSSFARVTR